VIALRPIAEWWRRGRPATRELPLSLLLVALSLLPALRGSGTEVGTLPDRPFDALAVGLVALQVLPLTLLWRWPAVSLPLVALGFFGDQARGYHTVAGVALPIALIVAGAQLRRHRLLIPALLTVLYAVLVVVLVALGGSEGVTGFAAFYVATALAWGIGAWLRSRRAAEAARRRDVAEATRAAERARIARELHDVVTHHVTAMVVQTEAARYLTAEPERLEATLDAIAGTGRSAIADLRQLLELLSPGRAGEPGTAYGMDVRTLVEQTRLAGQPVDLREEGRPSDDGGADLVVYRVVQEALTNALKYARGEPTLVRVCHGEGGIEVEVTTEGAVSQTTMPSGGRGLAGLRERVGELGGTFSAQPRQGGGFVVLAHLPTGDPS